MADVDRTIQTLRIVTSAMVTSLLTFAGVAAALRSQLAAAVADEVATWSFGALVVVTASSAGGYAVVHRQTRAALRGLAPQVRATAEPLAVVLDPYRRLVIARAALIEAPGLVALVVYLTGGSEGLLAMAGLSVLLLLSTLPSRAALQRLADDVWHG